MRGLMEHRGFIIDLDGVVYRGESAIEGAGRLVERLRAHKKKICFLTNNASLSRQGVAEKLNGMGIGARADEVITSAYAAGIYLKEKTNAKKLYVIGERGMKDELREAGFDVVDDVDARLQDAPKRAGSCDVDAVLVGLDRQFTYEKLKTAHAAILRGAVFVACNTDPNYPIENGEIAPGTGPLVSAVASAAGTKPYVVGKPNPFMLKICLGEMALEARDVALIGDRPEMDIIMANRARIFSVLVLTGMTNERAARALKGLMKPKLIVKSVKELGGMI